MEVDAVEEVDDVDEAAADEVAVVGDVAVTTAEDAAIALIDMRTSPEGTRGARLRALFSRTRSMHEQAQQV